MSSLNMKGKAVLGAIGVTALMVSGYSAQAAEKLSGRWVKIGVMVPLTGKGAEWGSTAKLASEIAAKEINDAGGIGGVKIRLVTYDTHAKEAEGINIINKLAVRDKVLAVSGPCFSSVVEIIYPMLNKLQVPTISYCSAKPGLSALSKWGFRNSLTSDKQLSPVVAAWTKAYKVKSVVIIHDLEDAVSKAEGAKILPVLFKKNGVKVLELLTYRTKDTDYSVQITKAKALNPDGIGLGSCYQQAAGIVKEMRRQGMKQPVVGGACAGAPGFITIGGKATEGSYMSTAAWTDDPRAKVQSFVKKMLAANGNKSFPYSGQRAYDNMYILKQIIEKNGVTNRSADLAKDRDRVRQGWADLKGYDGVSGVIAMDKVGDGAAVGARVLKVEGGKFVDVSAK